MFIKYVNSIGFDSFMCSCAIKNWVTQRHEGLQCLLPFYGLLSMANPPDQDIPLFFSKLTALEIENDHALAIMGWLVHDTHGEIPPTIFFLPIILVRPQFSIRCGGLTCIVHS